MKILPVMIWIVFALSYNFAGDKTVNFKLEKVTGYMEKGELSKGIEISGDVDIIKRKLRAEGREMEYFKIANEINIDLNGDGYPEYILSVDCNCTTNSNEFMLLFRKGDECFLQTFYTHWGDLKRDVKDLDGDGKYEIVVKEVYLESTGHAQCLEWPTIFAWNGDAYQPADPQKFKSFFQERGERIQRRLADEERSKIELEKQMGKMPQVEQEKMLMQLDILISQEQVGIFRIEQVLGDKNAGFDQAKMWLINANSQVRRNAVEVLKHIEDDKVIPILQQLANDQDEWIRKEVRATLNERTKK